MKRISQNEAERMTSRERAAWQNEVLKGLAQANRQRQEAQQNLENLGKAQTRRIMRPNL